MSDPTPRPEIKKIESKRPIGFSAEMSAARAKGGIRELGRYIAAKQREYRGVATPEDSKKLYETDKHAADLQRAAETKIDAVANPEKRLRKISNKTEAGPEHPGKNENEDVVLMEPSKELYGIFDGVHTAVGGSEAALMARHIIKTIDFSSCRSIDDYKAVLRDVFNEINDRIKQDNVDQARPSGSEISTAATVVKIVRRADGKRTAIIGNLGDSRVYRRFAGSDKLEKQTVDADRNTDLLGKINTVGDEAVIRVELDDGDDIVITSNGIHLYTSEAEMGKILNDEPNTNTATQQIMQTATNKINEQLRKNESVTAGDDKDRSIIVIPDDKDPLEDLIIKDKDMYLTTARNLTEPLPVPYDVVKIEAFKLAYKENERLMRTAFANTYDNGLINPVDLEAWKAVGVEDWIRLLNDRKADERFVRVLPEFRQKFLERKDDIEITELGDVWALHQILDDARDAGQINIYDIWIKKIVQRNPKILDRLKELGQPELTAYKTAPDDYPVSFDPAKIEMDQFDRSIVREMQAKKPGVNTQYLEQAEIKSDTNVIKALAGVITLENLNKSDTELKALPEVIALATKLGISPEGVAQVIVAQRMLITEQAAAQERAGRSTLKTVGRLGAIAAGGVALSMTGIGAIPTIGLLAGVRMADRIRTTQNQATEQSRHEATLLNQIKQSRKKFIDGNLTLGQAEATLKTTLETLAALLATQKEKELVDKGALTQADVQGEIYGKLIDDNCKTETDNLRQAQADYYSASEDQKSFYYQAVLRAQAEFDRVAEPYKRIAQAQANLVDMENKTAAQEKAQSQSSSRILKEIFGDKSEVLEAVATSAVFTSIGIAAREWPGLRVGMTTLAGARLGDTVARALISRAEGTSITEQNKRVKFFDIELRKPMNGSWINFVLNSRQEMNKFKERLQDNDFRQKSPTDYRAMQEIVTRYEQALSYIGALKNIKDLARLEPDAPTAKKRYHACVRGALAFTGAVAGYFVGDELVSLAAHRVESESVPVDHVEPNPVENPVVIPPPGGHTPIPFVGPILPEPPVQSADLTHIVHHTEGVSHAIKGQVSDREMSHLLNSTEVKVNGHNVKLLDVGVKDSEKISVAVHDVGGHKQVEFYDVATKQKIAPEHLNDYLYERGHEHDVPVPHEPVEVNPKITNFVNDYAEPRPGQSVARYIDSGLYTYVHSNPDQFPELQEIPAEELYEKPELRAVSIELVKHYRAESGGSWTGETAGRVAEPLAIPVVVEPKSVDLGQHFMGNGEPQNHGAFIDNIKTLLNSDKNHKIVSPNGLVFGLHDGQVTVDLHNVTGNHPPLSEKLYHELMTEYKTKLKSSSDHEFHRESFFAVLDRANEPHEMRLFEQDQFGLDKLPRDYSKFVTEVKHVMSVHADIDKFRGPNGLTYIEDHDKLYVRCAATRVELTPETYTKLINYFDRFIVTDKSYHGVFVPDQFNAALK